jgi:dihydroorotate dehydrogenase electron transfer subunit
MRPTNAIIEEVKSETPLVRTFRFDRTLDPAPVPGQYAMVWIRGADEIPMGFSGEDSITVHSVGEATQAMFRLSAGSSVGLRGPLGNGFSLKGDKILLIGGGVGVAPLAFLGETARSEGIEVTTLIGFRSEKDIVFKNRLKRLGDLIVTTDDGSLGIRGFASAGLKGLDIESYGQIYLCGPEIMMWDIISRLRPHASKVQASINRHFKCA